MIALCLHCQLPLVAVLVDGETVFSCPSKVRVLDAVDDWIEELGLAETLSELERIGRIVDALEIAALASGIEIEP